MTDSGWAPPPPPPAPEQPYAAPPPLPPDVEPVQRPRRTMRAFAAGGIAVIVAGGITAGVLAFRFLHGSADNLLSLAPSDAAVYVSVNLDPSGGQKLAMDGLLSKFPGLSSSSRDATINHWMDQAFADSGVNHSDVRAWFGSQVSFIVTGVVSSETPAYAAMLASSDDTKAQAMFDKLRTTTSGKRYQWTTSTHDGVTVTSGFRGSDGAAWAIVNHTVVIGSTNGIVYEVIDTAQGKHATLDSTAAYKTVQSQLPSDRIAFVFVDAQQVFAALKRSLGSISPLGSPSTPLGLNAYRSFGIAVVANSDGIEMQGTENYDSSKLSPDQRVSVGLVPHENGMIPYVPTDAYGFMAFGGLSQILHSVIDEVGTAFGAGFAGSLQQFGLTGPDGLISHLTGDAGLEVEPGGALPPQGTLMLGTDSSSAASSVLDEIVQRLCAATTACDASHVTSRAFQDAIIKSLPLAGAAGYEPSWTVTNGWIIIGSTPNAVADALLAKAHGGLSSTSTYHTVMSHLDTSNNAELYIDIHAIVTAIRGVLPPEMQSGFDTTAAGYLTPLRTFAMTSKNASDHVLITAFLSIG